MIATTEYDVGSLASTRRRSPPKGRITQELKDAFVGASS